MVEGKRVTSRRRPPFPSFHCHGCQFTRTRTTNKFSQSSLAALHGRRVTLHPVDDLRLAVRFAPLSRAPAVALTM